MKRLALTLGLILMVGAVASDAAAQAAAARFSISIDGTEIASFTSITNLGSYSEVIELQQSTPNGPVTRYIPGKVRYRNVTLVRPASNDLALNAWRAQVVAGDSSARKAARVTAYDAAGTAVLRYNLENAWPSALEVYTDPQSGALVESITLVNDSNQRTAL